MRFFKWAGLIVAGLAGLLVLAIVLVALLFDPNKYKSDIERLAQAQLNRNLKLEGDLKLSLFPWLAVQVASARLGERAGFGDQPFVTVNSARLSIRLLPLLHGAVEIGDVRLDQPSIHLITDERGRHNFGDLAGEDQAPQKNAPTGESGAVRASVASLDIRDGAVLVENRKDKSRTMIRDFSMSTGAISSSRPFDLQISLTMEQDQRPPIPVKLAATVTPDFEAQRHRLDKFSLDTRWVGEKKSDGVPLTLRVKSLALDLHQQTLALEGLELAAGHANLTGGLTGKNILDAPQFSGEVELAAVSPRDLLKDFAIAPPATRDASVLKQLSLRAQIQATKNSVGMQQAQLKLDDTTATGAVSIEDLKTMALHLDLGVDRIDFDRYLPPPEKKEKSSTPEKASAPTPIPVELLRALNVRGDLKIGEAKFAGMRMTKLHLGMNARDGNVHFAPTDAVVYGGEYRGALAIDASGQQPRLTVESHANNVDFAPLFKDMFDTQRVSGHGAANLKATGVGADTLAIQKSLNGAVDFNVTNGAFEGTDLWFEIRRARALLHRETAPTQTGPARTPFTSCKGSAAIRDGVLTNNDLDVAMQYLKVTGQGSVDLPKNTLDYRLIAQVLKMSETDQAANDLVDAQIPVKISGTLSSPTVRPDVEALVKARVQKEVDKQTDKLRQRLQDKLKDILGGKE